MLRGAIQRPIAVSMLFAALILIGVLGLTRLPVDLLPSIIYPRLTVVTTYADIPAEDLERLVSQPLEETITALAGVRNVITRTREGVSTITVEYEWGTQMDFANLHLREAIDRVAFRQDFPDQADRPLILRWDPTSRPISILVLRGADRIDELTEFAIEVVKPALEQESGVSQAEVVGGTVREILVQPDPAKLDIYGISISDIATALARSNVSTQGGRVKQGPLYLSLRIDGEYTNLEEIAQTDIQRAGRASIRIADVAQVIDTVKEPEGATLIGDERCVALLLYKEPTANTIKVSEAIDRALGVVGSDYEGFKYEFVYRDAEYVKESFAGLFQSLLVGGVLAIVVLFVFLQDAFSPLVIGLSIPVSILITFGLLYFGGVNLNLMSLGGLSLAAGMLVDNAIVVLENIYRHIGSKIDRRDTALASAHPASATNEERAMAEAAAGATGEVARPVLASTLTTIAVFFPVVYVPGIAGAFFRDQALTVTLALVVSAVSALLLQPVLFARPALTRTIAALTLFSGLAAAVLSLGGWMPEGDVRWALVFGCGMGLTILMAPIVRSVPLRPGIMRGFPLFRFSEWMFESFHARYHVLLVRVLRRPAPFLAVVVLGLVLAVVVLEHLGKGLMPERSSGDMRIDVELPAGTPLSETVETVSSLARWIEVDPAVRTVFAQVGKTETTLAAMKDFVAPNTSKLRVLLHPSRDAHVQGERLQREIAERLGAMDGVAYSFGEEGVGLGEILQTDGAAFQLGVLAEDPLMALSAAEEIETALHAIPGLVDIAVDRVLGTPNVVVQVDREEALRSGLNPEQLSQQLQARIAGIEATTFNEIEQRIDIAVRFAYDERTELNAALDAPVKLPSGKSVPLRSFLKIEEQRPVRELLRHNQRRMVMVNADVEGRDLDDVWVDARAAVAGLGLPPNIRVIEAGEREEISDSFRNLAMAMILAVVLVYMILAAQFESFLDPLLIAAVLPVGIAGAVLAMYLFGQTINILSMIGAVALLGIAVNDAIVKVDTIRRLREDGMEGMEAILEASRIRLRPILMTSVTTVLAMIPMAIGIGSGEQLQRPLAITIIGGLTMTTALTLFMTPALYKLGHRIGRPNATM